MLEKYPKELKIAYLHFPLRNHKQAFPAAMASRAAQAQGKFWEYHDLIFANMRELGEEKFKEFATQLGLDMEAFEKDSKDPNNIRKVQADYKAGIDAGVRGTPSIYINGKKVQDRSVKGLSARIDAALKEAGGE